MNYESLKANAPSGLRTAAAAALTTVGFLIAYYVFVIDQWDGPVAKPAYQAVVLALGALLATGAYLLSGRHLHFVLPLALGLEFLLLSVVDFSPVKPAKRALSLVAPGMAEPEVRAIFAAAFPKSGRFHTPDIPPIRNGLLSFTLDPHDGRYDAAIVQVTLRDGRVVGSRFLAD